MSDEFIPCRKCKDSITPGYLYREKKDPSTGVTYRYREQCECLKQHKKKELTKIRARRVGLRPSVYEQDYNPLTDYVGDKSSDSVMKVVKYVENFDTTYNHQSLYLFGPNGTQKTTIAQWVALEMIKAKKNVAYVLMRQFINALVENQYSRNDEDPTAKAAREEYIKRAVNSDLLIMDEAFDLSKVTIYKSQYQIPFLDEFLRDRMDVQEKPIIFVSNVPINQIDASTFSKSITNLLERQINSKGASLPFYDNYQDVANDFNVKDIFSGL